MSRHQPDFARAVQLGCLCLNHHMDSTTLLQSRTDSTSPASMRIPYFLLAALSSRQDLSSQDVAPGGQRPVVGMRADAREVAEQLVQVDRLHFRHRVVPPKRRSRRRKHGPQSPIAICRFGIGVPALNPGQPKKYKSNTRAHTPPPYTHSPSVPSPSILPGYQPWVATVVALSDRNLNRTPGRIIPTLN